MKTFYEWLNEARSAKFVLPSGEVRGGNNYSSYPAGTPAPATPAPAPNAPVQHGYNKPQQDQQGGQKYNDPQGTGMDQDTGQIYDQNKYNAWQKQQKTQQANQRAQQQANAKPIEQSIMDVKSALSQLMDKPELQGKSAQEIAAHPEYQQAIMKAMGVSDIKQVSGTLWKNIVPWLQSQASNRANYYQAMQKKNQPQQAQQPQQQAQQPQQAQQQAQPKQKGWFGSWFGG